VFLPNRRPPRPARAGKRPRLCRAAPRFRPPASVFPAFLPANRPRKVWNRPGSPAAAQIWPHVGPGCPPGPFPRLLQKPRRCRHVAPMRPQRPRPPPGLRHLPPVPGQPALRVPRRLPPGCAASPPCRPPAPQAPDPSSDPTRAPVHFPALLGESLCPGRGDQISGSDTLETARPSRVNFREIQGWGYLAQNEKISRPFRAAVAISVNYEEVYREYPNELAADPR